MPDVLLFLLSSIAITVMPGPDNLQVIARGASQGRKAGLAAAAGFASGCLFHTTLAALGLAAVLQSAPVAFQAIRWLGAAYLVWLGVQALRSQGGFGPAVSAQAAAPDLWQVFRQSVLANMLNPKVTLFFVVFLPQFVDARAGHAALQMLLLGGVFMAQTIVVFGLYGWCAAALGGWMRRTPRASVWLDRVSGCIFIGLGLRVALTK
ncbi:MULTISPECIES: LysE family translocator [Ralstonia solanacearum species complex]|uniref:LysE family transporter n=1 Tax=Ralstonia syzygii TaxID=28097 RepID=A0ABX7ZJA7_9RALS|nr:MULTISPECIES: LysE family translocator [Ralstonia solanacearum species complex]BEU73234.1 LysE family translocator [Ralstonia pseudosolanacearum]AMP38637.1 lysine transporter LysE [Ralstonia solanacearum]AXV78037.1 LysE family translocator [Ralstonia solanacearum]AXV87463.1 LysE family translocator [Ralstonia solanacearum]AXV92063.1 LysE family translocator [Ralstonia solanacearum]